MGVTCNIIDSFLYALNIHNKKQIKRSSHKGNFHLFVMLNQHLSVCCVLKSVCMRACVHAEPLIMSNSLPPCGL